MIVDDRPGRRFRPWAIVLLTVLAIVRPAAAQPFMEGTDYWFEPAVFPGNGAPKEHPRGPTQARGLLIWNGGYDSSKMALEKVPPIVQYFAEAGWDAHNLRRHTNVIGDKVPIVIMDAVERAKAMGYKRILLFGQSRGAFASIQTGSFKADIHGILPLAPAGFGDYGRSNDWRQNDFYIRSLWEGYKGTGIRVAAGFFTGDDWYETKQPHVRGPYATKRLTELGVPNFIIDQPSYPKMQSHGGGGGWEFARRYGPCLDLFFETGKRPACDDADPATGTTFRLPVVPLPGSKGTGFTGVWQGTNSTGRLVRLVIPPLHDERTEVFYQAGLGINGDKADTTRWLVRQRDGHLVRQTSTGDFRLYLENTDRLRTTYTEKGKTEAAEFGLFYRLVKS